MLRVGNIEFNSAMDSPLILVASSPYLYLDRHYQREKWKGVLRSGAGRPNEASMFLQLVVGFGLKQQFEEDFLRKLILQFASMPRLTIALGFGNKMAEKRISGYDILSNEREDARRKLMIEFLIFSLSNSETTWNDYLELIRKYYDFTILNLFNFISNYVIINQNVLIKTILI
nr:FRIGIDA-like protein 4A [Ipomoea batatas]